jgi:hypothetical protein
MYLLYVIFIETPIVVVFLANFTGVTTLWSNYQRSQIFEMAYQRDVAIAKKLLPEMKGDINGRSGEEEEINSTIIISKR